MDQTKVYQSAYEDAINRNQENMYVYSTFKESVTTAKTLLETLPDKLSHEVMVPVGKNALFRGKITNTNEFMTFIGAGYYVKKSAKQTVEYCNRALAHTEEMLIKLQQELDLLTSKLEKPDEFEAFGHEDRPEIVEHVTEEELDAWKITHREKEKEYRRKLTEIQCQEKKKIEDENDLWERLDQLELEEELEDELNRLHNDDDYDTDTTEEADDGTVEISEKSLITNSNNTADVVQSKISSPVRRKSVVFAETEKSGVSEPLYLHFKHSPTEPHSQIKNGITSPSDIYREYLSNLPTTPVSILKVKENPNKDFEMALRPMDEKEDSNSHVVSSGFEIPDVVDRRKIVKNVVEEPVRKISKFKASRMKK